MPSSRRSSTSSQDSFLSVRSDEPLNDASASTARLILVHDSDDEGHGGRASHSPTASFHFSDEDDESMDDEFEDDLFPSLDNLRSSSIPDLPPFGVFTYMLSPCLKLGALLVPTTVTSRLGLRWSIPALFGFAVLSVFARQIWYLLARYVRSVKTEEIIIDTFARGRDKARRRKVIRAAVRWSTALVRILSTVVYFRVAVDILQQRIPSTLWKLPTRPFLILLLALCVLPLSWASSLGTYRALYSTRLSLAVYVAWVSCAAYAYAQGSLPAAGGLGEPGRLWQPITVLAFACSSSWTLPLYSSLKRNVPPNGRAPAPKAFRSFRTLSLMSMAIAALLILPLLFFAPSAPKVQNISPQPLLAFLSSAVLLLGVPALFITTPPLPIPNVLRRITPFPISKAVLSLILIAGAFVPRPVFTVLADILLVLVLSGSYFLPAFIHIVTHTFKRPLAIVVPRTPLPSLTPTFPPSTPSRPSPALPPRSESYNDELLQRKELSMQKRRLWKRVAWDVGVWLLLVPLGGGGYVWAIGRVAGRW